MLGKGLLFNLLLAIVGILVPVLYSWLTLVAPGFPLSESSILALFVWLLSLIFSGFNLAMIHAKFVSSKFMYKKEGFYNASS